MGYLKYVRKLWNEDNSEFYKLMQARKVEWRREPATIRIEHPTRPDRARALGYKAKQGFIIVRQRIMRGGHTRPGKSPHKKSSNRSRTLTLATNYQHLAEKRASIKFPNCEVLNSYSVASDGIYYWYEIIMLDRDNPAVTSDKNTSWVYDTRGRAQRGLTSAGRRGRGLRVKGFGAEKARPSKRANQGPN